MEGASGSGRVSLPPGWGARYWEAKRAAVALGQPFEGLSRSDISARFGRVTGLVRDHPDGFGGDDDITMPLALQIAWEEHGLGASSLQVAHTWSRILPLTWFWAFRRRLLLGFKPPKSGEKTEHGGGHVGVMLIADLCGYAFPGQPERAQRAAWEMGQVCGAGEGIAAGEAVAWAASLIAGGASGPEAVKSAAEMPFLVPGPGRVPSLLREALSLSSLDDVVEAGVAFCEEPRLRDTILPGSLGRPEPWVHALPNLLAVMATWRLGPQESYGAACTAVELGWDTDSNAGVCATPFAVRDGLSSWPDTILDPLGPFLKSPLKSQSDLTLEQAGKRLDSLFEG